MSTTSYKPCLIMHACAGGHLEPLYCLHAARLKLLDSLLAPAATRDGSAAVTPADQEAILLAAAHFCFHETTELEGPAGSRQHQVRAATSELGLQG